MEVVHHGPLVRDPDENALPHHVVERLEREVGVDRSGTVAKEQRAVVHFACVAGFDNQRAARTAALAHQVMMNAGGGQEARNRAAHTVCVAIREDQNRVAGFDGIVSTAFQVLERALETPSALRQSNSIGRRMARNPGS